MIPKILEKVDLLVPHEVNIWFYQKGDSIILVSDALKFPKINLNSKINNRGEWIIRKQNKIVKVDENNSETIFTHDSAVGFVLVDNEIYSITKKGKNFLFREEKFSLFDQKYSFSILENNKKSIVFVNGKYLEFDKSIRYRINPNYINLVYDDYSIIVDVEGNVIKTTKGAFYLGKSSVGEIYQSLAGKIFVDKEYDLLGICTSDAYYLGEGSIGVVIVCDNKAKYYYKGGWSYLGSIYNLISNFVNHNYIILTNSTTVVMNSEAKKIFELNNVSSVFADTKFIYIISNLKKLYKIIPSDEDIIEVVNLKNSLSSPVLIRVNKENIGEVKLSKGLIQIGQRDLGDKIEIMIEPLRLMKTTGEIQISNESFKIVKELEIDSDEPEIDVEESYILQSINGKVKGYEDFYNSLLKLKIKYEIPSRLNKQLLIKVKGKEYFYNLDTKGVLEVEIPLTKFDSSEELITLALLRNSIKDFLKEYVVQTREVKPPSKFEEEIIVENAKKVVLKKREAERFEWLSISEYPEYYDNLFITKVGKIEFQGKIIDVKEGENKVVIEKGNMKREYIIYGLSDPIQGIQIKIRENKLYLKVLTSFPVLISAYYGTQLQTSREEFVFNIDPAYNVIKLKAYYSNSIYWEKELKINDLLKALISYAHNQAGLLKDKLSIFGVL